MSTHGRQGTQPAVGSWQQEFAEQPFRKKLTLARVADDRDLLAQMVELFRAESPKMFSAICTSVASGDATALARSAHALNGSMGNFGPTQSVDSARELERMGRKGVLAGVSERFTMLEEAHLPLQLGHPLSRSGESAPRWPAARGTVRKTAGSPWRSPAWGRAGLGGTPADRHGQSSDALTWLAAAIRDAASRGGIWPDRDSIFSMNPSSR